MTTSKRRRAKKRSTRSSPTGEVLIKLSLDESGEFVNVEVQPIGGNSCDNALTNSPKRQDEGGSECSSS